MSLVYFDLFHRRIQEARGEIPDTYSYTITDSFKKRFIMLLKNPPKTYSYYYKHGYAHDYKDIESIVDSLRMSFAVFSLDELSGSNTYNDRFNEIKFFILNHNDNNKIISAIECVCRYFLNLKYYEFIEAVNQYFLYDRIGYKFICENVGFIVRIEDEVFFCECTEKLLSILSLEKYRDVQIFFMNAYKKLAASDYADALVAIGRAIETLLKVRLMEIGITNTEKSALAALLEIAKNHITTPYSFKHFQQTLLEVGRARNQMGAHGVTPGQTPVADELHVRFAINQAAANLLFLAEVPMSN